MTASNQIRHAAGAAASQGGKYAPMGRSAQRGGLAIAPENQPPPLPAWGPDLEAGITDGIRRWTDGMQTKGEDTAKVVDLINAGEQAEMEQAYGKHRSDWLRSLNVNSVVFVDTIQHRGLPPETRIEGQLRIARGKRNIGSVNFGDKAGSPRVSVLAHCPHEPEVGPAAVTQQPNQGTSGKLTKLLNGEGELNDAADGTPAWRRFNSRGQQQDIQHYQGGALHSPTPGAPARIEHNSVMGTITTRAQHGVIMDGPNGEPSEEIAHLDGSSTQTYQMASGWTRTTHVDPAGQPFSSEIPDPLVPGAILFTRTDQASGIDKTTRIARDGSVVDGPNGEPAVEFKKLGRITSQTWKTSGVWTRTADYDSAGGVAVEFENRNWPGE